MIRVVSSLESSRIWISSLDKGYSICATASRDSSITNTSLYTGTWTVRKGKSVIITQDLCCGFSFLYLRNKIRVSIICRDWMERNISDIVKQAHRKINITAIPVTFYQFTPLVIDFPGVREYPLGWALPGKPSVLYTT